MEDIHGSKKEGRKEDRQKDHQEEEVEEVAEADLEKRRRTVVRPLLTMVRRLERTLAKVDADVARTAEADVWRHRGELLTTALRLVLPGAPSVAVRDFSAPGGPLVEVPLDAALSARDNLARCFRLYRKFAAGRPRALARRAEVATDLEAARAQLAQARAADATELEALEANLPRAAARPRAKSEPRLPYRIFVSATGHRILVGKSAKDNDALTFRHARGRDCWLHARGVTGAHVVIPASEGPPDRATLRDAALLALHFSAAKNTNAAEVSITTQRYVRRAKGAGPGAVTYSQERTVWTKADPERLAALRKTEH